MASYFISDLHLQPSEPKLAGGFYHFLDEIASDAKQLYILGDFFDAWIGDDEDGDFYLSIANRLQHLVDAGLPVYFQHGNRDFLISDAFCKKTGIQLLPEMHTLSLAGKQVMVMHGDSLCTGDIEYMAFRAQVRQPAWQQHVLSMPLEQRRQMAAQMRAQSQSMNSNKAEDIMDVNPNDVTALFEQNDIDVLLHGHTHRPARHAILHPTLNNKERIVLGDWGKTGWYLRADDHTLDLIEFLI